MPELPEVETVRRGLAHFLIGYRFTSAAGLHPRVVKPASLQPLAAVVGAKIKSVNRPYSAILVPTSSKLSTRK